MDKKELIRRKFKLKRKKNYYMINSNFFSPLKKIIFNKKKKNKFYISLYFPTSHEVDVLKIFENKLFKKCIFLLPKIEENYSMSFFKWKKKDILNVNKYGIPEPLKSNKIVPDVILAPLVAFDKNKNRLGNGMGFYDRYLHKFSLSKNKIITVGVAFSFQKYHKLPVNKKDFSLDYVITEKGVI